MFMNSKDSFLFGVIYELTKASKREAKTLPDKSMLNSQLNI